MSLCVFAQMKDKDEVGRMKEEYGADKLMDGLPIELREFTRHLETLTYAEQPDYDLLTRCLKLIVNRYALRILPARRP